MSQKRPPPISGSRGFDMLNEDILLLIIDHVDAMGDITSLSRVSHQFYRLAMPRLNRSMDLDLSLGSHSRLLRLLVKTPGRRPGLIQELGIYGLDKASSSTALDLFLALTKLKNLRSFSCDGSIIVPDCLLATLRHSESVRLENLETNMPMCGLPQPIHSILASSMRSCLSSFKFKITRPCDLYDHFKVDLVRMITSNQTLRILEIYNQCLASRPYPEMVTHFTNGTLPKLTDLMLITGTRMELFTASELSLWGARGGWTRLTTLQIQHIEYFPAFIGKTPVLEMLNFGLAKTNDLKKLRGYLEDPDSVCPFGDHLEKVRYQATADGLLHLSIWSGNRQLVPLWLLKKLPNITTLQVHRPYPNMVSVTGPGIHTATTTDICNMAKLCPGLVRLDIDIALHFSTANIPIFPMSSIRALSQFASLTHLTLYLHVANPGLADFVLTHSTYYEIFHTILEERVSLGFPCHSSFEIGFKIVRKYQKMKKHEDLPDYRLSLLDNGKVHFEKVVGRLPTLRENKSAAARKAFRLRSWMHRTLHGSSGYLEDFADRRVA